MKQWPFAHTIEMTHRLQDGVLEVRTKITNMSGEPMPVAIGFHPYFQLTDSPRDDWTIAVAARTHWLLAPNKIPTGETEPIERLFHRPRREAARPQPGRRVRRSGARRGRPRDDDGVREVAAARGDGRTQVPLDRHLGAASRQRGPRKPGAWCRPAPAPSGQPAPDRNFICFEPMAGVTDALNLAHKGIYKELESIAPGGTWAESFWVRPSGF